MGKSKYPEKLAVCLDTCHIFSAGYDIRTKETYEASMQKFDEVVGLDMIKFFHLNDSKNDFDSHKDRHEHIGQGFIGMDAFAFLLNDERFKNIGKSLETPVIKENKEDPDAGDKMNLAALRGLC